MKIYSVTDFRKELNELLGEVTVAVQGEITELNISQGRFVWFTLGDSETRLKCFMLTFQLKEAIEDGMEIRAIGSPTMFKKGQMVFRPRRIELVGEGSLKQQYELLKSQLTKEGVFDESRKRPMPRFPERIGLVTSRDAAAYTDVLRVLKNRWPHVQVYHRHVQVQGVQAVPSILEALSQLNEEHADTLECIILTRGGGSMEDLAAFNDESVVRAVFGSRLPIISGVGHERDVTLTDLAADVRAATPSNAAELLTPHRDDVRAEIAYQQEQLVRAVEQQVDGFAQRIRHAMSTLENQVQRQFTRFQHLRSQLTLALEHTLSQVQLRQQRVATLQGILQSVNPRTVLQRGYSITTTQEGTVVRSVSDITAGTQLTTQVADGTIVSQTERVTKRKN